jgi:hypothetical protein
MLTERNILISQKEFLPSCTLMELYATGDTTATDTNFTRKITGEDGLVYTERRLLLNIEFRTGLFMKIEQIKDYSGKWKTGLVS